MTWVFHQAALGDFVLLFPLLRGLGAPVRVVAPWSHARLAARVLEHVEPINCERREFVALYGDDPDEGASRELATATATGLGGATRIISFVSDGRDAWARNVAAIAPGAARCFVPPRPTDDWRGHVCDWHRESLARRGFVLADETQPELRQNPSGPVVVHPGSGGRAKCWPAERFERLIEALRQRGHSVRPIVGEVEAATWPGDRLDRWRRTLGLSVCDSLDALHDEVVAARLYVGNDAGPTHLAAQLGLPTLALFGPTDPARWAPRGPAVTVLAPPAPRPIDWLTLEDALAAAIRCLDHGSASRRGRGDARRRRG